MSEKFTVRQFNYRFPSEDACLEEIKVLRFGERLECAKCGKNNKFYKVKGRKAYQCNSCRYQIYPLAGTVFEKSTTPLKDWMYAIYLMTQTRAGISAKQLERMLGCTYKTAWRMFHQIRKLMGEDSLLTGEIEIDEAYMQPNSIFVKNRAAPYKRNSQILLGMVERGGKVKVTHVKRAGKALIPKIQQSVHEDAQLYTDSYQAYKVLWWIGYKHKMVNHMRGEYVRGNVHTQNIENFWSNMKRGIRGVYRHVDPKYLQAYANEYSFRYSHRNDSHMFDAVLKKI